MAIPSFALFYIVTEHPTGAVICFFWLFGNGIAHWCTDFVTSRVNTYLYKKGDTHNFFVCIGFDQWIHHITLGLSFAYAINLTMRTG